jgi:hypothetical protein
MTDAAPVNRFKHGQLRPLQRLLRKPTFLFLSAVVLASLSLGCRASDAAIVRCAPGPARPIPVATVSRTLRRYRFHLYRDPDGICDRTIVASLANIIYSGAYENLDQRNEITAREGDLFCDVHKQTQAGVTARHPRKLFQFSLPDPTDDGAWFLLANIDCQVHTGNSAVVERLRRGMLALRATLTRKR